MQVKQNDPLIYGGVYIEIISEELAILRDGENVFELKKENATYKAGSTANKGLSIGMCGKYVEEISEGFKVIWWDGSFRNAKSISILYQLKAWTTSEGKDKWYRVPLNIRGVYEMEGYEVKYKGDVSNWFELNIQ